MVQKGTAEVNSTRHSGWFGICAKGNNDFRVAPLPFICVKDSVKIAARMNRQYQNLRFLKPANFT